MATLNIINKSPYEKKTLEQCLSRIAVGDSVLMIEDAVVAALADTSLSKQLESVGENNPLYVLGPDLSARGLADSKMLSGIKTVDYPGFVELVADHQRVHSWL